MKTELLIRQEIDRWGPMSFYRFMELALYHPQLGYYSRGVTQRGRQGDYFTSLQASPLFPQILANAVISIRQQLDASEFSLVEFGSGGGEFLEQLVTTLIQRKELKGMRIFSVEKSPSARQNLKRRLSRFPKCQVVESLDDIDMAGGLEGCVFSNEFFDALPFHRLRYHTEGWKEIVIALENNSLTEIEVAVTDSQLMASLSSQEWIEGQEIEVRPQINSWYESLTSLMTRGAIVTFDYGYPRYQLYSPRRMNGTWLCYHQHVVNSEALNQIGQQDITAHVDFSQLNEVGQQFGFESSLFSSQGIFLAHMGTQEIQQYLDKSPETEKARRIGAVQQLIHPDSMGESFWALVQTKSMLLPPVLKELPNRIKRLLLA